MQLRVGARDKGAAAGKWDDGWMGWDEGVAHALLTCHDICPGKATATVRARSRERSRARAKSQPGAEQENRRTAECVLNFSFLRKFHSIESTGEGEGGRAGYIDGGVGV